MWDEIMDLAVRRPVHHLTDSFHPAAVTAFGVSVAGAAASDPMIAWTAALVAGGTVFVPRAIDWYHNIRAARREEDVKDLQEYNKILALEITKRLELEDKSRKFEDEIRSNRHEIRDLKQQIVFMKAAQQVTDSKVKILTTPDPDRVPQPEEPTQ